MRSRTPIALIAGLLLGFCGAASHSVLAERPGEPAGAPAPGLLPWQEARLFAEVYERIKRDYVDEVDDHALMETALRGMVAALDPHSAYLDRSQLEQVRVSTAGATPSTHSVEARTLAPGIGYLRITTFNEATPEELRRAIIRIKSSNDSRIMGYLIDLRNNPGGVLESGVAVADDFLDSGVIVTGDGRTPESRFSMEATPGDLSEGAPLVVLVNQGSASASEIVAAALKDHGRALLVGQRTYGKGSVQTVTPLAHGGAIKLTTSRYFTPSGASIQSVGLMPDVLAEEPVQAPDAAAADPQLAVALRLLQERLRAAAQPAAPGALVALRTAVP
ncbi:MAG: hypothetical protein JSR67_08775 [Proteobacteria bacterium]|nr:hypothetical protein [Pseudomonadota bacterium]